MKVVCARSPVTRKWEFVHAYSELHEDGALFLWRSNWLTDQLGRLESWFLIYDPHEELFLPSMSWARSIGARHETTMIAKRIRSMDRVYAAPLCSRVLNEQEKSQQLTVKGLPQKSDELACTAV